MAYRVAIGAVLLSLTGCFSEPPSSSGLSDATSDSSSGSSSTQAADETSTGIEESSSGLIGTSSTGPLGTSTGQSCVVEDGVEPPRVDSDIIVVLDEGVMLDEAPSTMLVDALGATNTRVAVFFPTAAGDTPPIDFDCTDGCGSCTGSSDLVGFPYASNPLVAVENAVSQGLLDCVLRPPPPGGEHSGPARQLWVITESPESAMEGDLAGLVTDELFRVHLACPGCDAQLEGVSNMLVNAVERTVGTVSSSDVPVQLFGQATAMASEHYSCLWPDAGLPVDIEVTSAAIGGGIEAALFYEGSGVGDCEAVEGGVGFYPAEGGVQMCPFACFNVQQRSAQNTMLSVCE